MYRLLIADDEKLVRDGLAGFVDWESLGFRLEGLFEDGSDVLAYLEENEADVILADIRMYEVSGLELAARVKEMYPGMRTVIVSAHGDFDYFRQALQLGLFDYLLKPVKKEELISVMSRLRNALEAEDSQRSGVSAVSDSCRAIALTAADGGDVGVMLTEWMESIRHFPRAERMGMVERLLHETHHALEERGVELPTRFTPRLIMLELESIPGDALSEAICARMGELTSVGKPRQGRLDAVELIKAYVEEHISEDFSVDDIARSAYLSSGHLSREYKRATGENISNYIIRMRMSLAMQLLTGSGRSIQQICQDCGYRDISYFHKAFKKYTGQTPREWRQRASGQEVKPNG